ncbi:glycoside hydrolase family 76 protein [Dichomitus squalens]|uniref:Glycoside hydrolase family 76 protein n=2 Tax=Dichomitus squalens TaxID=114155 RepID=A0A4Q9PZG0_9APHY|nr:glycoside hydrolase family 76 protein [Dichomitus squalens LYAD-421 SS1]EJF62105.1 glycoside hydrolase family 76 protein [Dichomitus squalens LYAD-421 SS1]TBU22278.1 glycoside hydrolase family 76 protein [Dichomitus squalens]TBU45351.1 glycoside hydrolase family 76 protein [Dichomitus squalens]TBU60222.1 glycoside hydrolase family 76 protein [Dichomitus squalens]
MVFNFKKLASIATLVTVMSTLCTYPSPVAASPLVPRAQCAATLSTAASVGSRLQSKYWNGSGWGIFWTDANTIEDFYNLMLADGSTTFDVADNTRIGQLALQQDRNAWISALNGSNDDAGWIVLSLWKVADYRSTHGQNAAPYLNSASIVYDLIAAEWDDSVCGGGVWWSSAHTYKNAITNELFLYISASGYNRFGNANYLANAKKTWNWLLNSGIRNSQGLWNDGLTSSCANNGQTTWIYNQGVIASGLGALYKATGDSSLITQAETTLDATINHLTVNGILKESCDNANPTSTCDNDQAMFKGIWMKHLQFYLDNVPDRVSKYQSFIGAQESAVVHYGTGSGWTVGNVWYAPSNGGSLFTAETQTSGLAAHVSAAKYGPC